MYPKKAEHTVRTVCSQRFLPEEFFPVEGAACPCRRCMRALCNMEMSIIADHRPPPSEKTAKPFFPDTEHISTRTFYA
jgi:hypothetical protein